MSDKSQGGVRKGGVRLLSVLLPVLLYSLMRFPALLHQPGGQDEQFFAVPGWTVLHEGIPRIPYLPTRNRPSFLKMPIAV